MFSFPDIAIIGVLALVLFGPDRLPTMMRQAGKVMREVQSTSQSFVAEMERAADYQEAAAAPPPEPNAEEAPLPDDDFGKSRPPMPPEAYELTFPDEPAESTIAEPSTLAQVERD
jgi:TatA/E family protein of Tat protein translocase